MQNKTIEKSHIWWHIWSVGFARKSSKVKSLTKQLHLPTHGDTMYITYDVYIMYLYNMDVCEYMDIIHMLGEGHLR